MIQHKHLEDGGQRGALVKGKSSAMIIHNSAEIGVLGAREGACPACGSVGERPQYVERRGEFNVMRCVLCGVFFADPMRNPGPAWWVNVHRTSVGVAPNRLCWYEKQFLRNPPLREGRLLEIGFGTGTVLRRAAGMGFSVTGIDYDNRVVSAAKFRGLREVYCVSAEEFLKSWSGPAFDIIVCFEVLEHLEAPGWFLHTSQAFLRPQGYLVLSVPDRERRPNLREDWDNPPNHLSWWSTRSLRKVLVRWGYHVLDIRTGGVDPVRFRFVRQARKATLPGEAMSSLPRVVSKVYTALGYAVAIAMRSTGANIYAVAQRN